MANPFTTALTSFPVTDPVPWMWSAYSSMMYQLRQLSHRVSLLELNSRTHTSSRAPALQPTAHPVFGCGTLATSHIGPTSLMPDPASRMTSVAWTNYPQLPHQTLGAPCSSRWPVMSTPAAPPHQAPPDCWMLSSSPSTVSATPYLRPPPVCSPRTTPWQPPLPPEGQPQVHLQHPPTTNVTNVNSNIKMCSICYEMGHQKQHCPHMLKTTLQPVIARISPIGEELSQPTTELSPIGVPELQPAEVMASLQAPTVTWLPAIISSNIKEKPGDAAHSNRTLTPSCVTKDEALAADENIPDESTTLEPHTAATTHPDWLTTMVAFEMTQSYHLLPLKESITNPPKSCMFLSVTWDIREGDHWFMEPKLRVRRKAGLLRLPVIQNVIMRPASMVDNQTVKSPTRFSCVSHCCSEPGEDKFQNQNKASWRTKRCGDCSCRKWCPRRDSQRSFTLVFFHFTPRNEFN